MRIPTHLLALAMLPGAASAGELSPWMGSHDQIPFQLDPTTMETVTYAAVDPLETGSTGEQVCLDPDCTQAAKPAMKMPSASQAAPQN